MSFLIGLQAPVLGFCELSQSFFISEHHHDHADHGHDDCLHHEDEKAPAPLDHEHSFILLEINDFSWSLKEPLKAPSHEIDLLPFAELQAQRDLRSLAFISAVVQPPPQNRVPLYRLHSVLRL
ncbi:hypothetical protein N9224_00745 [Akkermansiaceae bacterium]|nr:hypothetical protein [Akkermansiaceae bacterium]